MKVLVTGGSGLVGKAAVEHLFAKGHSIRILSRGAEEEAKHWPERVEPWPADVADEQAIRGCADGCQAIIHSAGTAHEKPPHLTFERLNVQGTRLILREAEASGIDRFVFVSSLGAERGQSPYHRSKREAEVLVEQSPLARWVIVRPGNVYGPGDEVLSYLIRSIRNAPVIPLVGWGDQPFQPIWSDDLGLALAILTEQNHPSRMAIDAAGPDVVTMKTVVQLTRQMTHCKTMALPLPTSLWGGIVWSSKQLNLPFPINGDQLRMLKEENVLRGPNLLTDWLSLEPTSFQKGLARLLDSQQPTLPSNKPGPLVEQRHELRVASSEPPAHIFREMKARFAQLLEQILVGVNPEFVGSTIIHEGLPITLKLPMRGHVQVRVLRVTEHDATAVTLEGHPLSGIITWGVYPDTSQSLLLRVHSFTRSSNLVDRLGMATVGRRAQNAVWGTFVTRAAEALNLKPLGEVMHSQQELQGEDAKAIDERVKALLQEFSRRQLVENVLTPTPLEQAKEAVRL